MFIGREHEIRFLKKWVFTTHPENGFSCSLRGPNGIGKTYLKNHMLEQFRQELEETNNQNVFVIDVFLHNASYYEFFLSIFKDAASYLTDDVLSNAPKTNRLSMDMLCKYLQVIHSINIKEIDSLCQERIHELLRNFFSATSALGYYFILIIDEFDCATTLYPQDTDDGALFRTLFELSAAKAGQFNRLLSVMLISRRRAGTIAHHMGGSNFDDAYPAGDTILRGFNEKEMEEYYQSYRELPCGELSERTREEIDFFIGKHPGMLMNLRRHIQTYCDNQEQIRMMDIYDNYGTDIRNAFSRMMSLLQSEYTDRANKIPAMSAFKQVFNIVPAYDTNLGSQAQLLYDYGLVSIQKSQTNNSEDIRPEVEKCLTVVRESWYAPLSKLFLLYVKENYPVSEKNEIHRLIDATEEKFRIFLQRNFLRIYGDTWQDQIDLSDFNKDDYWENLQRDAQEYGAIGRGVEVTVLDVLAFHNLGIIVKKHWEQLSRYLPSFDNKNKLYNSCYSLSKYRNCCMHGTLRILGVEQQNELKKICGLLLTDFDRYLEGKADEGEPAVPNQGDTSGNITEASQVIRSPISPRPQTNNNILSPIELQERSEQYNNTEHDFLCEMKKEPRGNLIGTLVDIKLPASIAPKDAARIVDQDPVGKVFRVRIVQWDNGPMAQKFNVVPII